MAKSFEQKKKDLEQMIEAQKEIIERKKIKGIDEYALKELEDQLKNMVYTS